MMEVTFYDRERETKEIIDTLRMKPRLITHLIEELPDNYVVFYINLRTRFLAGYDDFIESLFEMDTDRTVKKGKETLASPHHTWLGYSEVAS